jgi:GNAT superfamily N-acetyltransferase
VPEIRPATAADVAALSDLVEQYWAFEHIEGFDATGVARLLDRLLSQPQLGGAWVACVGGQLVGYLLAVFVFSLEHRGLTAEIDELFVVPEFRGRGAGALLLGTAERGFVANGCTNVSLQLARLNEAGREFYRRRGYAERSRYELFDKALPADRESVA